MRHVLTFIAGPTCTESLPQVVAKLTASFSGMPVRWLAPNRACDVELEYALSAGQFAALKEKTDAMRIDCVMQPLAHRHKKLLISDMDSTMIEQECIDELADCVGLKETVSAITARAMNGEIDFADALRERVRMLAGLPVATLAEVFDTRITMMPGAELLVKTMKARGSYCVLVSGGFTFFTGRVAAVLGFDAHEANQLEVGNATLTGAVTEPVLGKEAKHATLHKICMERSIPLGATLAVGDGANDLPMLHAAGLGVAYRAKPVVEASASAAIRFNDVSALLYLQGIAQCDWVRG
jgi:phosphoserine phosphatase